MKLEVADFLRLVEAGGNLFFWDCETHDKSMDYGGVLVVSIKPWHRKPISIVRPHGQSDRATVKAAIERLNEADLWVTYYGKGFDVRVLNTRALRWGLPQLQPKPHIDLYYTLKPKLALARRSQAHILEFLQTSQRKMTVSPVVWGDLMQDYEAGMKVLVRRCESDAAGLEALYSATKHLIRDIKA